MKSEPKVFSITDLRKAKNQCTYWEGVRNYQARNFLRDEIKKGDGVLFYHSSAEPSGIAGQALVVREGYPDHTAFSLKDPHYDPKSNPNRPIWYMVDVKFVRACKAIITLDRLRDLHALEKMWALKKGMRLSIQPLTKNEWDSIMDLPEWNAR